jgi:hypothetical protein
LVDRGDAAFVFDDSAFVFAVAVAFFARATLLFIVALARSSDRQPVYFQL